MKFIESIIAMFGAVAIVIVMGVLLAVLIGFPVMWLWNYVMPFIFGLPAITARQAMALFFLYHLFFRSGFSNKDKA